MASRLMDPRTTAIVTVIVACLTIVVILLTVIVLGLLRSHGEMLRAFNELGVTFGNDTTDAHSGARGTTTTIPDPQRKSVPHAKDLVVARAGDNTVFDISGTTPKGGALAVGLTGRNERTLLCFLTSGCATCRNFWDAFANDAALPRSVDRLVIVTKSNDEESPAALNNLAPRDHAVVMSSQAWDDYGVPASPYFVLVDGATGSIDGEGAATTWTQVGSLLSRAEADVEAENERRIDSELRKAGIQPNDPTLYPTDAES